MPEGGGTLVCCKSPDELYIASGLFYWWLVKLLTMVRGASGLFYWWLVKLVTMVRGASGLFYWWLVKLLTMVRGASGLFCWWLVKLVIITSQGVIFFLVILLAITI